jgi:hypothetical protein
MTKLLRMRIISITTKIPIFVMILEGNLLKMVVLLLIFPLSLLLVYQYRLARKPTTVESCFGRVGGRLTLLLDFPSTIPSIAVGITTAKIEAESNNPD